MSMTEPLTSAEVAAIADVAAVLLPGDEQAPGAASVAGLAALIQQAAVALGTECDAVRAALRIVGDDISWDTLRAFAQEHPAHFDILSVAASGAYFMAPEALTAIGYPQGARKAPRIDQAADEISSGVLDQVMGRDPMFREVPA
jgi:hypothetical protein